MKLGRIILVASMMILINLVLINDALIAQSSSSNYQIEENYIGPGGQLDASSTNFQQRSSLGDTGIGNSSSSNFQLYGGYTTVREEVLEFIVNTTTVDLGVLSDASTATGTATFSIRNYTSHGYVVITAGEPPASGSYTLTNKATQAAPSTGTEEFGINVVANTSPATFGADPVQQPDASFSFGVASSGYDTANQYKYVAGETIAESPSSSGQTDFTISYIANIDNVTPGGVYTMSQKLIAVPTF